MKKFMTKEDIALYVSKQAETFAVIRNPEGIFPPLEYVPLAEKIDSPLQQLKAVVCDMDGTTTTTEGLCIHSLEYMVRKITGTMDTRVWKGLDPVKDYPHIIGNSTTRHVEYLIETYGNRIIQDELKQSFLKAALWFLLMGRDERRNSEVRQNLITLNCKSFLEFSETIKRETLDPENAWQKLNNNILKNCFTDSQSLSFTQTVKMAVDIYYQRYHEILAAIGRHEAVPGLDNSSALIEPMPGIGIYLALIKGLLGEEIEKMIPLLKKAYKEKSGCPWKEEEKLSHKLVQVSCTFEKDPAKIAIVTSSIFYEARIVMTQVFNILQQQAELWPLSAERKSRILKTFDAYENVYDAFVTASDSNEIRLKPHRDLYSIALHQMGIHKNDYNKVIGFEDSESGTISIRAAGVGLCCALPFHETKGHDLSAASVVLHGGIPETILKYFAFIKTGD